MYPVQLEMSDCGRYRVSIRTQPALEKLTVELGEYRTLLQKMFEEARSKPVEVSPLVEDNRSWFDRCFKPEPQMEPHIDNEAYLLAERLKHVTNGLKWLAAADFDYACYTVEAEEIPFEYFMMTLLPGTFQHDAVYHQSS